MLRPIRLLALTAALLVGSGLGWGAARYAEPLPPPHLSLRLPPGDLVGTIGPAVTPPVAGDFVLSDSATGVRAAHLPDQVAPMASIAKTMTALALLQAYPLQPEVQGPGVTVIGADVQALQAVERAGGTFLPVQVGQVLTERDLLLGMMLPSANNYALIVGRWVDGSDSVFVQRLNRMANTLGMGHTHFADPDGLDPGTVSTASDLLILAQAALKTPVLVEVMARAQATLSQGTQVTNLDSLVGSEPGWLGIKTGHSGVAGYCLLFAARRSIGTAGLTLTVVGAVLGEASREASLSLAQTAVNADFADYTTLDVRALAATVIGSVTNEWGDSSTTLPGRLRSPAILILGGTRMTLSFAPVVLSPTAPANADVGGLHVLISGSSGPAIDLVTQRDLGQPSPIWRLIRSSGG